MRKREPIIVDFGGEDRGDLIFLAGDPGLPLAIGRIRPMALVHSMWVDPSVRRMHRALLVYSLSSFAQGYIRNRPFIPRGCLFHVAPGNSTMEIFARTLGSQPEAGSTYRIDYTEEYHGILKP